jgi:hypothetical protein
MARPDGALVVDARVRIAIATDARAPERASSA